MIIDSFMFNDELDILELRLGQLEKSVDYFVFNEMRTTHSGKSKPLYYLDNKEKFSRWGSKIIHGIFERGPGGSWELETAQRADLQRLVMSLNPRGEDTLSTSDCDEIPNPEVLLSYTPSMGLRNLKQFTYWYNFNHLMDYGSRSSSRARLGTVQNMHDAGGLGNFHGGPKDDMDPNFPFIDKAGWHCSYFSEGLERVRRKVNSFAHDDLSPFINGRTDKQLADDIYNGRNIYHLIGVGGSKLVPILPETHPPYVLENMERFKMFTNQNFYDKHKALLQEPDTGAGIVLYPARIPRTLVAASLPRRANAPVRPLTRR